VAAVRWEERVRVAVAAGGVLAPVRRPTPARRRGGDGAAREGMVLVGRGGAAYTVGARHDRAGGRASACCEIATLYRVARVVPADGMAGTDESRCVVKIARSAGDDDLVAREAAALRRLARLGDPRYAAYVPRLVDTVRFREGQAPGATRRANVLGLLGGLSPRVPSPSSRNRELGRPDDFVTLAQARAAYPAGLDPRDVAWMWRRLLVAIGYAHRAGVAHGAVLPEHVLIHPAQHGLVLVDWCYSAVPDPADGAVVGVQPRAGGADDPSRRIPALVEAYADWYPPEVARREPPGAATDIALASRCVSYLLGSADPARLGGAVPAPIRRFLTGCLLPSPSMRPDDAWRLLAELDELLGRIYGPRRFRPFTMPSPSP
ncbi:protein kinase family protein, partial [Frankia nepalensis]|uniref:molecular chaperone DnaJ n=1 Tax=Frankia nepalensis TaxID=1836974 RepID=UPI001EE3F6A0